MNPRDYIIEAIIAYQTADGKTKYKSSNKSNKVIINPDTKEPEEVMQPHKVKYGKHETQRKFKSVGQLKVGGRKSRITKMVNHSLGHHINPSVKTLPTRTKFAREFIHKSNKDFDWVREKNRELALKDK